MPTTPRKHPARTRQGAYAEAVRASWVAAAYLWPCPTCPCTTNLRGLLREDCAHCHHVHTPQEEPPSHDTP